MLYKQRTSKFYYVKLKSQGKTIRRSTGETNKRHAERFQEQLRSELKSLRKQSAYTFYDAALRWLREKEHKRSIEGDKTIIKWLSPHLADLYLSEITRDKIEELRQLKLEEAGKQTVNNYMRCLRSILRIARDDWEWISHIPRVPMYPKVERMPRFLTFAQFTLLVAELPSHLAGPAWFAVSTGLRTRAIQSLQWDWISRDGVRFPPEVMKNQEWLTIPLSQAAWYVLAETLSGDTVTNKTHVFVNHVGKPFHEKFTKAAWRKATIRAGLDGVRFHDLRHTFASWMLQKGIPEHVIMELGGWKTREAFKIYAGHSRESLERLAGYV